MWNLVCNIEPVEYRKSSCLYTIFFIHIHRFSQEKQTNYNNFPEVIGIEVFSPLCSWLLLSWGSLWCSLVVPGWWSQSYTWLPGELLKLGTTGLFAFHFFFLQNEHCVVPQGSDFCRISIVFTHQVQTILHLVTIINNLLSYKYVQFAILNPKVQLYPYNCSEKLLAKSGAGIGYSLTEEFRNLGGPFHTWWLYGRFSQKKSLPAAPSLPRAVILFMSFNIDPWDVL